MNLTREDFLGRWSLSRAIDDRRAGRPGTFVGTAEFTADGPGAANYVEEGQLMVPGLVAMKASRRYRWVFAGAEIEVFFEDGRPFHTIRGDVGAPAAHHDCPPDVYDVTYDFARFPLWRATWEVRGPAKDYTMQTDYAPLGSSAT